MAADADVALVSTHLFLLLPQAVPHGGHNLGNLPERRVGILSLDGSLRVPEEQRVRRHGFLRFVGVFFLLPLFASSSSSPFPATSGRDAGRGRRERQLGQGGVQGDDSGGHGQGDGRFHQDALMCPPGGRTADETK